MMFSSFKAPRLSGMIGLYNVLLFRDPLLSGMTGFYNVFLLDRNMFAQ